jgi:hypothetical protein
MAAPNLEVTHCATHKARLASKALTTVPLFQALENLLSRTYNFIRARWNMSGWSCKLC